MVPPIIFNLFNVRRYGEIEFWLTLQKIFTFVLIIIYGMLIALGASASAPLSGTDANNNVVSCNNPAIDRCVGPIGFASMNPFNNLLTI
jgi:amino acid permease